MVTIGKKKSPAVRLILGSSDALCDGSHASAIRIDALQRTLSIRRIDDYTFASPATAPSSESRGEHLRRSPGHGHLQQFAVREKGHVGGIRREEGITRALRSGQKR